MLVALITFVFVFVFVSVQMLVVLQYWWLENWSNALWAMLCNALWQICNILVTRILFCQNPDSNRNEIYLDKIKVTYSMAMWFVKTFVKAIIDNFKCFTDVGSGERAHSVLRDRDFAARRLTYTTMMSEVIIKYDFIHDLLMELTPTSWRWWLCWLWM